MAAGKAYGENRDYQLLCRDILQHINEATSLFPYEDDGIDVKFSHLGGTNITFDIALKDSIGNFVVAECRRRMDPVKQEAMFAFAHKVELLRKQTGRMVAGVFFAKHNYQIGSVKHADWSGIQVVILNQNQSVQNFVLIYQKYDSQREKRLQEGIVSVTEEIAVKGSLSLQVTRGDGTTENLGTV